MYRLQVLRPTEFPTIRAEDHHRVAPTLQTATDHAVRMLEESDDANHRGRIDRFAVGFVVETDVAARNRHTERAARGADSFDGARELPHDGRPLGIAEIQTVRGAKWTAAGT